MKLYCGNFNCLTNQYGHCKLAAASNGDCDKHSPARLALKDKLSELMKEFHAKELEAAELVVLMRKYKTTLEEMK